ncbi:hypothetical protein Bca52824_064992 [Brassica carinata]|uniref:Uncharacterized protein n=1 Tax=Brassica carinata TaxID=52824 RepID=A0A8X7U944_BRACI|nr:hypothetical protein Bca52824_064992 [Brassica carinata]
MGFGGKALEWLVDALKTRPEGSPDFIIIDCPAGIDAGFITAITPANEAALAVMVEEEPKKRGFFSFFGG